MDKQALLYLNAARDIGVLLAAMMGIWKWGFQEWLRRRKEVPSIEGNLKASISKHSENTVIVSIEADWCTKSPRRMYANTTDTCIEVFLVPINYQIGALMVKPGYVEPISRIFPYGDLKTLVLGPINKYTHSSHFVLESNKRYLFRWRLYTLSDEFRHTRELIVDTSTSESTAENEDIDKEGHD